MIVLAPKHAVTSYPPIARTSPRSFWTLDVQMEAEETIEDVIRYLVDTFQKGEVRPPVKLRVKIPESRQDTPKGREFEFIMEDEYELNTLLRTFEFGIAMSANRKVEPVPPTTPSPTNTGAPSVVWSGVDYNSGTIASG